MTFNGDLVGHGPTRTKQSSLHAKEVGRHPLQGVDRRILTENIISQRSHTHGLLHLRRWPGDRIRPKIDSHAAKLKRSWIIFFAKGLNFVEITMSNI
jgi:hypothetical protein